MCGSDATAERIFVLQAGLASQVSKVDLSKFM